MHTVALACPLWWVARWAARLLTGLAVAVAFAVGAGALPAAASAHAGTLPVAPAHAGLPEATAIPGTVPPAVAAPVTAVSVDLPGCRQVGDERVTGADERAAIAPADPADPGRAGVAVAADPAHAPAGHTPGAAGPRAPPRG